MLVGTYLERLREHMISIVIPNYNGKHFLKGCLDSILKQSFTDIEIIVVDNNSSDGSREYLLDEYLQVRLVSLSTNTGFSPAVNEGIKLAKGEYVFLLNNDTELVEGCLESLFKFILKDNSIFSVNARMIQFYDRDYLDDAGDEYNCFGWAFKRGFNQSISTNKNSKRVFSCCAGASLYRKSVFDEIGLFDENFFAYLEDVDIGYRANCFGYKNYYCSEASVYHIISGTTGNAKSEFKTKLSARNNSYLIYKNMPVLQLIINFPLIVLGIVIKALFFYKVGYSKIYFMESIKAIKKFKNLEKNKFKFKNSLNYAWIQWKLMMNCFFFVKERVAIFVHRKMEV